MSTFLLNKRIMDSMRPDHVAELNKNAGADILGKSSQRHQPYSLELAYRRRSQQTDMKSRRKTNASKIGESKLKASAKSIIEVVKKEKEDEMVEAGLNSSQWKWKPSRTEMSELVGSSKHQIKYQRLPRPPLDEQMLPLELRNEIE